MKRILLSLGMIVFIGAVVAGATGAFFSDTETSTGNTFAAGEIDLTVDSTAHYAGLICDSTTHLWVDDNPTGTTRPDLIGQPCSGSWTLTDLGVSNKFFDLADIKPGDEGENTISLHIDSNPAWACVDVNITKNDDVSSVEPELEAGDVTNTDSIFDGELAQNLKFAAWLDQGATLGFQGSNDPTEGDNIWQQASEPLLFSNQSGPASDVLGGKTYKLADSTTGSGPIPAGQTNYIGLAWCAGTQTVGSTITCDGAGMGNIAQTDSMVADIAFRVEQSRNNSNFVCGNVLPEPDTTHSLRLENETEVTGGPWIVHSSDQIYADLAWTGDGLTFNYTLNGIGLAPSTAYSLIYYADGWPGNNPGAFIGSGTSNGSGNISFSGTPNLGIDLPTSPDGNLSVGAKIWLVRSSDYNGGSPTTGPMTAWNPSQYLFEGNVYIHYDDTNSPS